MAYIFTDGQFSILYKSHIQEHFMIDMFIVCQYSRRLVLTVILLSVLQKENILIKIHLKGFTKWRSCLVFIHS